MKMENKNFEDLWCPLKGSLAEKNFLQERFRELSVQEGIKVEAIAKLDPPISAAELINVMEQLYRVDVYYGLSTPEKLGWFVACEREHTAREALPFIDLGKVAQDFMNERDGVIVDGGYAELWRPFDTIYNGRNLSEMRGGEWAIKFKVASSQCPDGVWIDFPAVDMKIGQDDPSVYLNVLGAESWEDCTLLATRCRFADFQKIGNEFESMGVLMQAASNLGYIYEQEHGSETWQKFEMVLECEHCTQLGAALELYDNLDSYEFVPGGEKLTEWGMSLAVKRSLFAACSLSADNFDARAYALQEIENLGMRQCGGGYLGQMDGPFSRQTTLPALSISL